MRTLSGTLDAAQRALVDLRPVIKLDVSDRPVELPRFDWVPVSSEAVATCHGAACLANDGAVLRVRVLTDGTLQAARVVNLGGDWPSAWVALAGGPYSTTGQCSIGCMMDGPTAALSYVSADGLHVYYRMSADGGATWGVEQVLQTAPAGMAFKGVGLCGTAGALFAVVTLDTGGAEPNDNLYPAMYTAGSGWLNGTLKPGYQASVTTCAVTMVGAVLYILTGGPQGLAHYSYDPLGHVWTGPVAVAPVDLSSGYVADCPRLSYSPDGSGRWYYTWRESWSASVAGSRYWVSASPAAGVVGEGLIFGSNRGYGLDVLKVGDVWYLVGSVIHYTAPGYSGSAAQRADLGGDVVAFDLHEEGPNKPTRGRVWLRNDDGRYASPGTGMYGMLREGSRVCLGLGYVTSAGVEYAWLPPLWVEGWRYAQGDGEAYLVLELGDAWSYLDRCVMRAQLSLAGLTYGAIVQQLCYRVSSALVGAVGGLGIVADVFTVRPAETVGSVLRRVLSGAGVRLRFGTVPVGGDPGAWDSVVAESVEIGAGVSGYAFGPGAHEVLRAEYGDRGQLVNLVEVYGKGFWDWRIDREHMLAAGHLYVEKATDWFLDSGTDVGDRAQRLLDGAQSALTVGWLECLPWLGAELYDVVAVTDARAGLSGAVRRVGALRWRFDGRKRGVWLQRLELEGL